MATESNTELIKRVLRKQCDPKCLHTFIIPTKDAEELCSRLEQLQAENAALVKFRANRVDKEIMDGTIKLVTKQLQAKIERQQEVIRKLLPLAKIYVSVIRSDGIPTPKKDTIIAKAEEFLK